MTASAMASTHTLAHNLSVGRDYLINQGAKFASKKEKLIFKSSRIGKSAGISQLEDFHMTRISSLIYIRFPHTKSRRTASLLRILPLIKLRLCFDVATSCGMAAQSDRDGGRSRSSRDFCQKRDGFLTLTHIFLVKVVPTNWEMWQL